MNSNDLETSLLSSPSTVWRESLRIADETAARMTLLRYRAFAAEWRKGKNLAEVAQALGISHGLAGMTVIRARAALGTVEIPFRNRKNGKKRE